MSLHRCRNNGVTGVITNEHYVQGAFEGYRRFKAMHPALPKEEIDQLWQEEKSKFLTSQETWQICVERNEVQIFSFCSTRHLLRNPREVGYLTGTEDDLDHLLKNLTISEASFFVPFSQGQALMRSQRSFITTLVDFQNVFGPGATSSVF